MAHSVYFALGSNLGDRLANLQAAVKAFSPAVRVESESHVYETEPWGYAEQPLFLNQVIKARTELSPRELLTYIKGIEERLGRTPSFLNGPRLIDIDILIYDELVTSSTRLTLPHPRMAERAFVLVPLAELAPGLVLPGTEKTVEALLRQVGRGGIKEFHA